MPAYELAGTVKVVLDQQTFSSGFTKREFVVTTEDDRYPQDIKFECIKDRCALLDPVSEGQRVKVTFDIRGNEHNGRYYVNLNAWKIEGVDASDAPPDDVFPSDADGMPVDDMPPGVVPF